ncbi:MAG: hypothetical protein M3Q20_06445 [Actinomycetota bacterium]|nr:hypothetical protein [Actinomycetota bacterium]
MTRRLGAVVLILALLILVIPLAIGMVMAPCPECDFGESPTSALCIVALVLAGLAFAPGIVATHRIRPVLTGSDEATHILERPPRAA